MKAAILTGIKKIRIEDRPNPKIVNDTDVLVRIKAVGVCGSDVHYFLRGRIGNVVVKGPHILGHESSGEVVETGKSVPKSLKPGTRVAIEPGVPCGECDLCKKGKYNICTDIKFFGAYPIEGAYREYVVMPYKYLYPVSDKVSFESAALIEPFVVGLHSVNLAKIKLMDSIAVLGAGSIGLTTLRAAILNGAGKSFITDKLDYRLKIAKKYGAQEIINVEKQNPVNVIIDKTDGKGVDIVFESAGQPETFQQTIEIVKPGGKVVLIGICEDDMIPLNMSIARRKGVTIKLVRRFAHTYPRAVELVERGLIDLDLLVSHRFSLEKIVTAFELVEKYEDNVLKPIIML